MAKIPKTYRVAEDVVEFLEGQGPRAETVTLEEAVRVLRDLRTALGPDWYEVERRSKVSGTSVGQVLAELAQAGLRKRGPK